MTLKKRSNFFLLIIIILSIISFSVYKYAYKPHKKTEDVTILFKGSSNDFIKKINIEPDSWNGKAIQLQGQISSIENEGVLLNSNTFCQFENNKTLTKLREGQTITIKGIVVGFDDLLNELKLNQCIILKK